MARGVIVARIKPGAEEEVARIFGDSDAGELPRLVGVRHRSLYVFEDVYIHLVESDDEFEAAVDRVRTNELFAGVSAQLADHIEPYNPQTWHGPKDAMARCFYAWDA